MWIEVRKLNEEEKEKEEEEEKEEKSLSISLRPFGRRRLKKPQRRNITPLSICIITTEHKIQIFGQNKNLKLISTCLFYNIY